MRQLPTRYYLYCEPALRARFLQGAELLGAHGMTVVISAVPVQTAVNVTELSLNPELPGADVLVRALAVAAGVSLCTAQRGSA